MGNFCFSGFILFPKPLSLRCHDPSLRTADSSGGRENRFDASDDPISGTEVRSHLSGRSNHSSWQALCVNDLDLQPATWDAAQNSSEKSNSLWHAKHASFTHFETRKQTAEGQSKSPRTHTWLMPLRLKLQIPPVHIVSTVKCSADGLGTIEAGHPVPETSTTHLSI